MTEKRATRKETEPRRSKFDSILLGGETGKSRPGWMAAVVLEAGSEKPPLREETGGALQHRCPPSPPVQHSSVPGKQGGAGHATLIHNVLLSYFQAVVWTRPLVCMAVHVRLLAPSLAHLHQMFKPFHSRRSGPGSTGEMRNLR